MEKKLLEKIEEFNRKKIKHRKKSLFFPGKAFLIMLTYFIIMVHIFIKYEKELSNALYVYLLLIIGFVAIIMFMAISDDKNESKNNKTEANIKKENDKLLDKIFSENELLKICNEEVNEIKKIINDKISNYEYKISVSQVKNNIKINININDVYIYRAINDKLKETIGITKEDLNEIFIDKLIKKEIIKHSKKFGKTLDEIIKNVKVNYKFPYGNYKGNETNKFYRDLYGVIKKYKNNNSNIENFDYDEIYGFSSEQFSNYEFVDDIEKDIFININFNIIKEETKKWIHSINANNEEIIKKKQFINSRNTHEYENHCWNCHAHIDSKVNSRCFECGWYICDECGACSVINHNH